MAPATPSASDLSAEPVNNELNVVLHASAGPESGKTGEVENEDHEEL